MSGKEPNDLDLFFNGAFDDVAADEWNRQLPAQSGPVVAHGTQGTQEPVALIERLSQKHEETAKALYKRRVADASAYECNLYGVRMGGDSRERHRKVHTPRYGAVECPWHYVYYDTSSKSAMTAHRASYRHTPAQEAYLDRWRTCPLCDQVYTDWHELWTEDHTCGQYRTNRFPCATCRICVNREEFLRDHQHHQPPP